MVGWYKRGTIDDKSVTQDIFKRNGDAANIEGQVELGSISYHIYQLRPTNCRVFETNQLGQHFTYLKI